MNKRQEEFLDHFARLGVFSKVQSLMGSGGESESDVIKSQDEPSSSKAASKGGKMSNYWDGKRIKYLITNIDSASGGSDPLEDAKEILPGKGNNRFKRLR